MALGELFRNLGLRSYHPPGTDHTALHLFPHISVEGDGLGGDDGPRAGESLGGKGWVQGPALANR